MKSNKDGLSVSQLVKGMVACRLNAKALQEEADILLAANRFARAYVLLHTACEELGKFAILEIAARGVCHGRSRDWKRFWQRFRAHNSKTAQLEVQLSLLGLSSNEALDLAKFSEALFGRGLQIRNGALYVDVAPDGSFRQPVEIDFSVPLPALRAVTDLALKAALGRGDTVQEIEAGFRATHEPTEIQVAKQLLTKAVERCRDMGMDHGMVIELLTKTLS